MCQTVGKNSEMCARALQVRKMKMEPAKENDPQKGFIVRSFLASAEQPGGPTQYEPQASYDLSFQPPSLIRQASTSLDTPQPQQYPQLSLCQLV